MAKKDSEYRALSRDELNQLAGVESDAILEAQLIRPTSDSPRPA